jgi:glucose-6-phosphate isomerase
MFASWAWIGEHYSLWGILSLSIARYIGHGDLAQRLKDNHGLDQYFDQTPLNVPQQELICGVTRTDRQHSLYQIIHRGRILTATYFMERTTNHDPITNSNYHHILLSNFSRPVRGTSFGKMDVDVRKRDARSEQDV